jgi:hypothetical protein
VEEFSNPNVESTTTATSVRRKVAFDRDVANMICSFED